ncbi:hypothetical protein [Lichenicola sp.]|uniref:hypothetical protein n=1 Tax=Lichenicola sp. TaxID=2804529 RepID=UPI003AFF666B
MFYQSTAGQWPRLLLGMGLTLIAALSVHVVMLQGLHVPYPDNSIVGWPARYLNVALAMFATILFNRLADPRLSGYSWLPRSLVLFLIYSMLHEALVRAVVMDGVTTTAWTFSLLKNLPAIITNFITCIAIVLVSPRLDRLWQKALGAMLLAVLVWFVCKPALGWAFSGILESLSFLAHEDVYSEPYGWEVLVPAYITFAEPVVAAFLIAVLVWDRLSVHPWIRGAQLVALIMLMKGSVAPTLLYSIYLKSDLGTAMMSEGQFGLETLTLSVMTASFWHFSRRPPRLATLPS